MLNRPYFPPEVISSITSTKLRKIIFPASHKGESIIFAHGTEAETWADKQLCDLADRLRMMGCRHTLEVEVRFMKNGGVQGGYHFAKVLPKFREKGVVSIVDFANGRRLLHSSTRNRVTVK